MLYLETGLIRSGGLNAEPEGSEQSSKTTGCSTPASGDPYVLRYWRLGEEETQVKSPDGFRHMGSLLCLFHVWNASESAWILPEATLKVCIGEEAAVERLKNSRERVSTARRGWSEAPWEGISGIKGWSAFPVLLRGIRVQGRIFGIFVCLFI